ncbi:nucleoside-diphosphate-sugar epimerase family protein [Seiridium cupressi]
MSKVLLITGATGKQGGAVIDALLKLSSSKFTILAVTRNATGGGAKKLAQKSPSIKIVQGDLDDCPALFDEAQRVESTPIWGVYSVQISMGKGVTMDSEVAQGKALIDESMKRGVRHFVYSSVERGGDEHSWSNPTPIPHFQSKYHIENYLRDVTSKSQGGQQMSWTILRPVAFMDNLAPGMPTKVFLAAMNNWLQGKSTQWIACKDIGVFAAKAFDNPEDWSKRAVGLAGDELTVDQMNSAFEKATGSPVPMAFWFLGSFLTYMVTELRLMIGWFADEGYKASIKQRQADYPQLLTLEQWLKEESDFAKK